MISLIEKIFFELIIVKYACKDSKSTFYVSQGINLVITQLYSTLCFFDAWLQ